MKNTFYQQTSAELLLKYYDFKDCIVSLRSGNFKLENVKEKTQAFTLPVFYEVLWILA